MLKRKTFIVGVVSASSRWRLERRISIEYLLDVQVYILVVVVSTDLSVPEQWIISHHNRALSSLTFLLFWTGAKTQLSPRCYN